MAGCSDERRMRLRTLPARMLGSTPIECRRREGRPLSPFARGVAARRLAAHRRCFLAVAHVRRIGGRCGLSSLSSCIYARAASGHRAPLKGHGHPHMTLWPKSNGGESQNSAQTGDPYASNNIQITHPLPLTWYDKTEGKKQLHGLFYMYELPND